MKRGSLIAGGLSVSIAILLAACAAPGNPNAEATQQPVAVATAAPANATAAPANTAAAQAPVIGGTAAAGTSANQATQLTLGITGIGEVMATRDASLVFTVNGTVDEVLVEEGATVTETQVLARLDTRRFDQAVRQAEAALASAQAGETALLNPPRAAELQAARAQVRQAEIALAQAQVQEPQDVRTAESALTAAQAGLQSTRDQLSRNKTQADAAVETAAQSLTAAQAAYAKAKTDWDFVRETNQNPSQPDTVNPQTGEEEANTVEETVREQYYAAFVQAETALRQAEQQVQQAAITAEEARKAEVVGIQQAEQQVTQAEASLRRSSLPVDQNRVASLQASLDQARAGLAQLQPDPTDADRIQAAASVTQAQVALEGALLDQADAELRAPFDGIISEINIDPGDPSSTGAAPAMTIVDISDLHIDVAINDVDIGQVRLGQQAEAYIEAAPGQVYSGTVSYISPTATTTGNIRTYVVRIDLDEQENLRPGMSARVELITE